MSIIPLELHGCQVGQSGVVICFLPVHAELRGCKSTRTRNSELNSRGSGGSQKGGLYQSALTCNHTSGSQLRLPKPARHPGFDLH